MTFDGFSADERTIDAVERNIEIIGEAARHIPEVIQARYPSVPWAQMRGMRNVLIHDYPAVSLSILWETTTQNLPPLIPLLKDIVAREAEG